MVNLASGMIRFRRRRSVPLWRSVSFCFVLLAVSALQFSMPLAALADPGAKAPHARPDSPRSQDAPRRIPGEGVQEEPPQAEDDEGEGRKAAPQPDIGGCPYRGRRLELIV